MSAVNEPIGFPDLGSRHFKFLDKTDAMLLLISSSLLPYKNCKELRFKKITLLQLKRIGTH